MSKKFGGVTALCGVNLNLRSKEILGLIGPNGAGKTTLFNIIAGVYRPDTGRVFLEGFDVTGLNPEQMCRRGVARTFQIPRPFQDMTVYENVKVGAVFGTSVGHNPDERVRMTLKELEFEDYSNRISGGLSLVEQRRLEIARAMATNPRILLIDESMAGLAPPEIESFVRLLRQLKSRTSVILTEHILSAVTQVSDRIAVLHQGVKIAEGPPGEVTGDSQVRDAYLGEEYA